MRSPKIFKEFRMDQDLAQRHEGWICFNIIIGGVSGKDLDLFFGPFEKDEVVFHLSKSEWGSLLATLGIFSSATQARKNGWGKDIPDGFSEARFKKQRTVVFVFKQPPSKWQRFKQWLSTQAHQLRPDARKLTKDTKKPMKTG